MGPTLRRPKKCPNSSEIDRFCQWFLCTFAGLILETFGPDFGPRLSKLWTQTLDPDVPDFGPKLSTQTFHTLDPDFGPRLSKVRSRTFHTHFARAFYRFWRVFYILILFSRLSSRFYRILRVFYILVLFSRLWSLGEIQIELCRQTLGSQFGVLSLLLL